MFVLSVQAIGFIPVVDPVEVTADECGIVSTEVVALALEPL